MALGYVPRVDVLVPTRGRPAALAVTLACLIGQTFRDFRVVISDQTDPEPSFTRPEVATACRVLEIRGTPVERHHHVPRRGIAEQRQFLLEQATAPYVWFLDDDVITEPTLLERLVRALDREGCGFIGAALLGPHRVGDVRPHQERVEFWDGPVRPERIRPGGPEWPRAALHLAANLHHLATRLGLDERNERLYKVAWVGGCALFDRSKLEAVGGFKFWRELPEVHVGEDVLAQLRVMEAWGGAGLIPSGAWHQDLLPTTHPDREHDAPWLLGADATEEDEPQPAAVGAADR